MIKSKTNKATKVALALAVMLIFMMVLVLLAQTGGGDGGWLNWILVILIAVFSIWFFIKRKKRDAPKTQYEIIKYIADREFKESVKTLNVLEVNVERGGARETYVHFMENRITYLYLDGVGVVETHVGKNIGDVKREKQKDEIAMAVAKTGIASQSNREKLVAAGLYKDTDEG